jgi:CDP-paratose 2-epimerase
VSAFEAFHENPRVAAVYNLGGGRESNCSMLEAIALCEEIAGRELDWTLSGQARMGDHRWWISDLSGFRADYPGWELEYDVGGMLNEIHERNVEHWTARA